MEKVTAKQKYTTQQNTLKRGITRDPQWSSQKYTCKLDLSLYKGIQKVI